MQNQRFGEQFKVETFEIIVPATILGIRKYLGSGLIKGIGAVMAGRMVDLFGLETLEVIEKTPERLVEVEGIGPKRVTMITEAWREQREIKDIMIFLQGNGVGADVLCQNLQSSMGISRFKGSGKIPIASVRIFTG